MDYLKSCFDQVNVVDGIVLVLGLVALTAIGTIIWLNVHVGGLSLILAMIIMLLLAYMILLSIRPEAAKNLYLSGTLVWVATFMLFVSLYRNLFPKTNLLASLTTKSNMYYLIPFIACLITLLWNFLLLSTSVKGDQGKSDYEGEVKLVKFIERNGYYIILAITAIFLFLGTDMVRNIRRFHLSPFFYLWMLSSIAIQACGVLPLIWAPVNDAKRLAWIRHFKTVWYTISIYVFFFGIVALGKSLIPGVINILK